MAESALRPGSMPSIMDDPRWRKVQASLEARDDGCASLLRELFHAVPVNNFGVCKTAMATIVGERSADSMACAATLVDLMLHFWTDTSAPIAYLLLMTLDELRIEATEYVADATRCHLQALVVRALDGSDTVDAKVVTKAIGLFSLHAVDDELVLAYGRRLVHNQEYISVLKLVAAFPALRWDFSWLLEQLVATNSWSMAEQLLKAAPSESLHALTTHLVELTLAKQDTKKAHKFVHLYGLQATFPDVESWFRREALEKLCAQKKWSIATSFVGTDASLQATLYQYVAMAGNSDLANELYDRFQLQVDRIDALSSLDGDNTDDARCLGWSLPAEAIVFCDSDATIQDLYTSVLSRVEEGKHPVWLGIDVEWRPLVSKDETCLASLLQLALADRVFLVDLVALEATRTGLDVVEAILRHASVLKIGFGFKHDLRVLKHTFPDKTSFDVVHGLVDMGALLRSWQPFYTGRSLSDGVALVLGRPLNKKQQLSDWEKRPLTPKQAEYAALDAWVLVAMAQRMCRSSDELYTGCIESITCDVPPSRPVADIVRLRRARQHAKTASVTTQTRIADFVKQHENKCIRLFPRSEFDANNEGASVHLANSLCILANGAPYVVVLPQDAKVDLSLLSMVLGVARKKVRFARPAECTSVFGYAPGTVPPFAHDVAAPVLLDTVLKGAERIVLGGGTSDVLLEASFEALLELCHAPRVLPLAVQHDITSLQAAPQELKFLADTMLGRVAKWLRMTGADVVHWDKCDEKSNMLIQATVEHRIVLTRDRKLAKQRQALACYVVLSDNIEAQFQEIKKHFSIEFKEETFMSRCAKCNGKGFRIVPLEEIRVGDDVPARVLETVTDFWACLLCAQLYWVGPKYSTAHAKMQEIFGDISSQ